MNGAQRRQAIDLYRELGTVAAVASALGIRHEVVSRSLKAAGVRLRRQRYVTTRDRREWQAARDKGEPVTAIARRLDRPVRSIYRHTVAPSAPSPAPRRMDARRPDAPTDATRGHRLRIAPDTTEAESFARCIAEALAEHLPHEHRREALRLLGA